MTTHTGLTWHKSSYSRRESNCVETTTRPGTVYVRDSKLGDTSPILTATPAAWTAFITALQHPTTG
jgi:hypothetical protein